MPDGRFSERDVREILEQAVSREQEQTYSLEDIQSIGRDVGVSDDIIRDVANKLLMRRSVVGSLAPSWVAEWKYAAGGLLTGAVLFPTIGVVLTLGVPLGMVGGILIMATCGTIARFLYVKRNPQLRFQLLSGGFWLGLGLATVAAIRLPADLPSIIAVFGVASSLAGATAIWLRERFGMFRNRFMSLSQAASHANTETDSLQPPNGDDEPVMFGVVAQMA